MAAESPFDRAWEHWRAAVTAALASPEVPAPTRAALHEAGAFDAADGLIRREWALGLLTEDEHSRRLSARGLSAAAVDSLVALLRQHPTPAAGG